jgi:hypothetical protein
MSITKSSTVIGCMFHCHKGERLVNVIRSKSWQHCRIFVPTPSEPFTIQMRVRIDHIKPDMIMWPEMFT